MPKPAGRDAAGIADPASAQDDHRERCAHTGTDQLFICPSVLRGKSGRPVNASGRHGRRAWLRWNVLVRFLGRPLNSEPGKISQVLLKACVNGPRSPAEHQALPATPEALARDVALVTTAGVGAVHFHPKNAAGLDTLEADPVAAALVAAGSSTARGAARRHDRGMGRSPSRRSAPVWSVPGGCCLTSRR